MCIATSMLDYEVYYFVLVQLELRFLKHLLLLFVKPHVLIQGTILARVKFLVKSRGFCIINALNSFHVPLLYCGRRLSHCIGTAKSNAVQLSNDNS